MTDKLIGKGRVNTRAYDANGKLLWEDTIDNMIVDRGKRSVCHLLAGDVSGRSITNIGFGTSGTGTTTGDTGLTGLYSKAIGSVSYPSTTSVQINATLGLAEDNGVTIQELGLFTADGNLFSRITRPSIIKTVAISLVITWTITF